MNNMAILAKNGPIKVVLKYDKISTKFKVVQGTILYGDRVIKNGDDLIITVLAKRFYNKDNFISVYGFIDDIPTEEQVKNFTEVLVEESEIVEQQKQLVEYVTFNEDDNDDNNKNNVVLKENDVMKQSRILEL